MHTKLVARGHPPGADTPAKTAPNSVCDRLYESLQKIEILGEAIACLRQKVTGTFEPRDAPKATDCLQQSATLVLSRLMEILEDVSVLSAQL